MSWIKEIADAEAQGALRGIYERARDPATKKIIPITKAMSLGVETLTKFQEFNRQVTRNTQELNRVQVDMMAVLVSVVNKCYY